ncbi:hypothetical protein [Bdellovibrio sp. NC01]|uniref:hypothetical protein n=1 Tax=Bdellovibrio sp. NC01 TaxID=2220073 RepID=UPI00115A5D8C|nr:hypothetical protein [Bdellovibrio sp. NC01]QDK38191.1 hypothetical protein DOE51_11655 [Bdellovibrio sp. NC01]
MKHISLVLAMGLGLGLQAGAADSPLCEDAAKLTCTPGSYNDGTGTVTLKSDAFTEAADKAAESLKKVEPKLQSEIQAYLKNNTYFKRVASAGLGLDISPDCQAKEAANQKACEDNIVTGLVELAKKSMNPQMIYGVYGAGGGYGGGYGGMMGDGGQPTTGGAQTGQPGTGQQTSPYGTNYGMTADMQNMMYVMSDKGFRDIIGDGMKAVNDNSVSTRSTKLIQDKIFPDVKSLLVKKISELPIAEDKKQLMMDKVKGIRFGGTDCSIMGVAGVSETFMPNAFYSPTEQSFTVCKGFLGDNLSEFGMSMFIAHELAHSIDPCGLSTAPEGVGITYSSFKPLAEKEKEYPITGLISCLRSEKSMNAVHKDLPPSKAAESSKESVAASMCENDQIGEAVADWFGTEVMAAYITKNHPNLTKTQWQNGVTNVFRTACSAPNQPAALWDEHPSVPTRVNAGVLQNPIVRQKMGCSPSNTRVYCDATNPDAMAQKTAAPKGRVQMTFPAHGDPATTSPATSNGGVQ